MIIALAGERAFGKWALVAPCLTLMTELAPPRDHSRDHSLQDWFNG
jgi:hypothetical protein